MAADLYPRAMKTTHAAEETLSCGDLFRGARRRPAVHTLCAVFRSAFLSVFLSVFLDA
jgi:hypothetical protein